METVMLIFFFILFYSFAHYFFSNFKHKKRGNLNIWLFAISTGIVLTFVTLLLLPRYASLMPAQNQAFEILSFLPEKKSRTKNQEEFISNFLLIDNSYSHQNILLPDNRNIFDTSSSISITDRHELAVLLNNLAQADSLVDLIICDIYFDLQSPKDSLLNQALKKSEIASRILLSHNYLQPNTPLFSSLPDSVFGNIVENGENNFFSKYSLFYKHTPSLPVLIAERITGNKYKAFANNILISQKDFSGRTRYGVNHFLPKFNLTEKQTLNDKYLMSDEYELSESRYLTLGDAISENGSIDLLLQLKQRKENGKKNYLFIGAFNSKEDHHDTFFGKLSGPVILLNLTYALVQKQHLLSIFYIFYLWFSLSYIIVVLIKISLRISFNYPFKKQIEQLFRRPEQKNDEYPKTIKARFIKSIYAVFNLFFLDELHFWLVILLVITTALLLGKLVNGFGLLFVFLILYKTLQLLNDEIGRNKV